MEEGLLKNTGKDLKHWIGVVKKSGLEKHGEILKMLKADHGFTHGFANFVSMKARKADAGSHDDKDLLKEQYNGKEHLKEIFDALNEAISSWGSDITVTPKRDSVSFIRKHQFALLKPATKTRMDVGLKLKGQEPEGILGNSGPFGAMCTHRICLTSKDEITKEVMDWIKLAYDKSV